MDIKRFTPALTLPVFLCLNAPAFAQATCAGGEYAADAIVTPPSDIGSVTGASQWAWDGGEDLEQVCNLLTDSSFFATWELYSGEIDATHSGICVSLLAEDGTSWFSCQTPDAVLAAFEAPVGTAAAVLTFDTWQTGLPGS